MPSKVLGNVWRIGDFGNLFSMVNAIVFMVVVVGHHKGLFNVLDVPYARDGFCISFQDKSVYYQSHAICFYSDTAFCLLLTILFKMADGTASEKAIAPLKNVIPGHFFHGAVHMYIAFDDFKEPTAFEEGTSMVEIGKNLGILTLFWFFLLKSVMV